jgi:hypothetical protein
MKILKKKGLEDAASGVGAGGVGDIRKLFGATDVKPVDANTIQSILSIRRPFTGMQSSRLNVPFSSSLINLQGLQGVRLNQPSTIFGPIPTGEEGGKIDDDGGVTPGELNFLAFKTLSKSFLNFDISKLRLGTS